MLQIFHKTAQLLLLPTLLSTACIAIPNEVPSADNPRKATATVDNNGRTITGGHLTLIIPAGAIPIGERIQVTIDLITGSPEGHVGESYLVSPEGYQFQQAIEVQYQYSAHMIEEVSEPEALFVGVANGAGWNRLSDAQNDTGTFLAKAKVAHFSVFGLVDPNAGNVVITDAGYPDNASSSDAASHDVASQDAGFSDSSSDDATATPDANNTTVNRLSFQLTWDDADADLDLHLLQSTGEPYNNQTDCYFANCRQIDNPLDWPPTGAENNPMMDIDDISGFGPENTHIDQAISGHYSLGVHLYDFHSSDPAPIPFHVRIYDDSSLVRTIDATASDCDGFYYVADLSITSNGSNVDILAREDAPVSLGKGNCPQ